MAHLMNVEKPSKRHAPSHAIPHATFTQNPNGSVTATMYPAVSPEEDFSTYTSVPYRLIQQKHAPVVPCWGCIRTFRKPIDPEADPAMTKLYEIYDHNIRTTSERQTADAIRAAFYELVYRPAMEDEDDDVMDWPVDVILAHIQGKHVVSKDAEIRQSIMTLSNVEREIRDNLFLMKDDVPGLRMDDKRIKSLCEVLTTKKKYLDALKD